MEHVHEVLFDGVGSHIYNHIVPWVMMPVRWRIVDDVAGHLTTRAVLDVGTCPGKLVVALARRLPSVTVFGVDLSPDMMGIARENARRQGMGGQVDFFEKIPLTCFKDNFVIHFCDPFNPALRSLEVQGADPLTPTCPLAPPQAPILVST